MSRFPIAVSALTFLLCASPALVAGEGAVESAAADSKAKAVKDGKFRMGEVTVAVTADLDPIETANTTINAEQIQQLNRDDISSALALLPGVSVSLGGARNEAMFYLRGNDPRQTPVFVDGVPCYIPYDGNIDYARFTTSDVAEIQVAKGFSSIAYGANTLGGAINVVTRKPVAAFEGDIRAGIFEGNGRTTAVNLGSNQGWWYAQGGLAYSKADSWRMSSDFVPNAREDGGERDHSGYSDKKLSLKVGLTPNATDEYAIGIIRQRGEKSSPVSTDLTTTARYWDWPLWNMDSTFLVTRTALGDKSYVKFRAYFDRYENGIDSYTDSTYTTLKTSGSGAMSPYGHSRYRDFSHGLMAEVGTMAFANHSVKAVLQTKTDVHREGDYTQPDTASMPHFEDRYLIMGVEDSITLTPTLDLSVGAGWDQMKPEKSGSTWELSESRSKWHGQAGLFWKVTPSTQVYATLAQKDHFATLKDRYSLRFGTYYANPGLVPETSTNYEVGVKSNPTAWLQVEAALFRSDIKNLIQSVYVETVGTTKMYQMQNIGKVQHEGVELALGVKPNKYVKGGLGYTYLDRDNRSGATVLTGTPKHRVTGYLRVDPLETLYVQASVQSQGRVCDSSSQASATGLVTSTYVGGFATADVAIGWQPAAKLAFDAGLKNALDRNYQYSTGYPMPGRTWFANARYTF
ncbi:MAG: TonB-dependent receptor [Holophagaceae bacterium]|nr:TonB-dependent receptor [Holophagaceae bacterium]